MKKTKITLVVLFAIVAITIVGCAEQKITPGNNDGDTQQETEGEIVMTITDAAANMESVSEIRMTVDNVQAHSKAEGWTTLSSETKTYNLLELNAENRHELLAQTQARAGTYNQIRFDVEEVVVIKDDGSEHEARVPSNEYKINVQMDVNANSTSTATIDILADESLHVTGNGEYVMAPVARVETRSNTQAQIRNDNSVQITGGQTTATTKVGMDINGNVGVNMNVPRNANLTVTGASGTGLEIAGLTNENTQTEGNGEIAIGITDAAANMEHVNEVTITVDEINAHSQTEGWVTITTENQEYDLLELRDQGEIKLASNTEVGAGTYDQIRLNVNEVIVVDAQGEHEARLPSGQLRLMESFDVNQDSTTAVTLDFMLDQSLHMTGNGMYILTPVVQVNATEDADLNVQSRNRIEIRGGSSKKSSNFGMDINGEMQADAKIPENAELMIGGNGKIEFNENNTVNTRTNIAVGIN